MLDSPPYFFWDFLGLIFSQGVQFRVEFFPFFNCSDMGFFSLQLDSALQLVRFSPFVPGVRALL